MSCASLQVMKTARSKLSVGAAAAGVWAWAAAETSSIAPVARVMRTMIGFPSLLVANGAAGDVARRAADQAGADHRAEAAAGHGRDTGAQRRAGDCALLAGRHVLAAAEDTGRQEQHKDLVFQHFYSPATLPLAEAPQHCITPAGRLLPDPHGP